MKDDLEKRISAIEERNRKVELDKSWETSTARKIIIAILTYIIIVLFFLAADLPKPFINPIIPTIGFLLSTMTLPIFKKIWLEKHTSNQKTK